VPINKSTMIHPRLLNIKQHLIFGNNDIVKNFTKETKSLNHVEEKRVQCETTISKTNQSNQKPKKTLEKWKPPRLT
jgi:hypothetical protein